MIKSFYTIGKVLSQDENYAEYFEPWANPFPKVKGDEAKVIFAQVNNGVLVEELIEEVFSKKRVDSYLYRKVQGANGTNLVPTLLLQMESNFDKYADNVRKLIKKVKQSLLNNKHTFINVSQIDIVEQKLIAFHGFMSNDKRYLFSMKIDNKYFGDFEEYKELFREEAYRKYYKDSKSKNKVCSITYQKSDEVWGRVDTLGFTVDAVTFSRNGFDVSESYKMFPVSPEAVKILEGAKRIIIDSDLNLTRNFYGLKYFILPHFVGANDEIINEIITSFINKSATNSLESEGKGIIGNETIINEIITDENLSRDDIYYDIFFYQPNNAQFLIKLHLSDVLPSRFSEIFRAKKRIEEKYKVLNRILIKAKNSKSSDIIKEFKINFGGFYEKGMPPMYGVKDYFSQKVRTDTIFHPYFYKILEAVFYGNQLNEENILKAFMEKIVAAFKNVKENPNDFTRHVKTSFVIYQFFNELGLFNSTKMDEKNTTQDEISLKIDDFVQQHNDFFENNDVKKGAFYLGILTNLLLEKQNSHLQNKPFMNQLNGLNVDIESMKKIHLKVIDKLYQYNDKLKKAEHELIEKLNPLIAQNLIKKNLFSRTELSYAFALGLVMQKEFFYYQLRTEKSN
jgi:CRISPR-associated Csh1 family protein